MKCKKCDSEVDNNLKFCPNCGAKINKKKISVITIITLILFVISIMIIIGGLVWAGSYSGTQAGGWIAIFSIGAGFIIIPFFCGIFLISLVLDLIGAKNYIKIPVVILLLLVPVIWVARVKIDTDKDASRREYTFDKVSVTFPEDMNRYGYSPGYGGNYNYVGVEFSSRDKDDKDVCTIEFNIDKYRDDLDLSSNIRERIDHFRFANADKTVYEVFDTSKALKSDNVNGKTWNYYEEEYDNFHYKAYALVLDKQLYTIELVDKSLDHNSCAERFENFLSTVKYK